jgi:hypothetical protein
LGGLGELKEFDHGGAQKNLLAYKIFLVLWVRVAFEGEAYPDSKSIAEEHKLCSTISID